jgi:hypothetical protein
MVAFTRVNIVVTAQIPRARTNTESAAKLLSLARTRRPMRMSWMKVSIMEVLGVSGHSGAAGRRGGMALGKIDEGETQKVPIPPRWTAAPPVGSDADVAWVNLMVTREPKGNLIGAGAYHPKR